MANNIFKTFQSIGDQTRALLAGQKPKTNAQAALDRYTSQPVRTNSPWYESDPGFIEDHKNYTGHDNVVEKEKIEKINKPYTGGADNPDEALNYLASMYTTPEQEEKYRKASVANQRIMAVADALRHIGNIYHTTKGAPAQKFNSPVMEEYGRYRQEKALRDAANYKYLSYKQAKQRQDAAIAKMERDYELKRAELGARAALNDARIKRQNNLAAFDDERLKGQIAKNEHQEQVNKSYPEIQAAKIREIESRIAKNGRSGGRSSGGGSGRGGKYYLELPDGTTRYYQTKTMWEKDVDKYYPKKPLEQLSVTTNAEGKKSNTQRTQNYTTRAANGEKQSAAQRARKKGGQKISTGVKWQ